jgi:hypothetical protein
MVESAARQANEPNEPNEPSKPNERADHAAPADPAADPATGSTAGSRRHTALSLVTVVTEALLERRLIEDLTDLGVTGYTMTSARGRGSRGSRAGDIEGGNVRFEVIASDELAEALLNRVAERYFEHYAVAAWLSRVEVLRGDKYV